MTDNVTPVASPSASARSRIRQFFQYAQSRATVMRAFRMATVITPILTLMNHYQEIRDLEFSGRFWFQVVLTFCVPYCVSTYSSAMTALASHEKMEAAAGGSR